MSTKRHDFTSALAGILGLVAIACAACQVADAGGQANAGAPAGGGGFFSSSAPADHQLPAGRAVTVRLAESIESGSASQGQPVEGRTVGDIQVDGKTLIPDGSVVRGEVVEAKSAKHFGGQASIKVAFREIETPSGATIPVVGELVAAAKKQTGKDTATIAGSAVGGALLGEVLDGKAAEGAVVGGGIGTAVAARKGDEALLEAGRQVVVTTTAPTRLPEARS